MKKISYSVVGDDYDIKDPIKLLAQKEAQATGANLRRHGFEEVSATRGESAYVWRQGDIYMASVVEGLGTKNLVADAMKEITGWSYYDVVGYDTVATVVNDLISVGARPLVVHAYWAIEDNSWLLDEGRMRDLINGWRSACDLAGASWGGGETATLKGIVMKNTAEFGGSAVGIIEKKRLVTDKGLAAGDRILFLRSNGINANGISLARAVGAKTGLGYAAKLPSGVMFGEAILKRTNIYAGVVSALQEAGIEIHYLSNLTGHGLRKVMRAKREFTYMLENVFEPQEEFGFIQKEAGLAEKEMYETYNMGQDYAIFLRERDVAEAIEIIGKTGFGVLDAGYICEGERKVVLEQKGIVLEGDSLKLKG